MPGSDLQKTALGYYQNGDFAKAAQAFTDAQAAYLAEGDKALAAEMQSNLGVVYRAQKDYPKALTTLEGAIADFRTLDDKHRLALALGNLGRKKLHPLRLAGLSGITLLLFAGGLVVSVKIGGGSNLHNMDSFLLVLLLWGAYLWSGRFAAEEQGARAWSPWPLIALAALLPLYPLVLQGGPVTFYDYPRAAYEVNVLKGEIQPVLQRGGKVLFIWQRQIETFQMIGAVPIIPDYETVDLMEMAMSDNRPYLERFYADLRQGKYDLIITMKQGVTYQGPDEAFPEENNVWVRQVQAPLMTYYEEVRSLDYSRTLILKPRPSGAQTGADCPTPAPHPSANPADAPLQPTLQGQAVPICPAKAP
jgi:hypothetical protein